MPPKLILDDEDYASEEDSDFAPDQAPTRTSDTSSDEDSDAEDQLKAKPKSAKRKRGRDEEAEDVGFENSGDEAIIERGLKRQKKKGKKGKDTEEEDDDDGDSKGGLIKTRSMRAQEKGEKRKPLADTTASTVDVDALWERMISGKPIPAPEPVPAQSAINTRGSLSPTARGTPDGRKDTSSSSTFGNDPDSMIKIKRIFNFAGKVHVEQKLVPRDSAEAKLWLASQSHAVASPPPTEARANESLSPFTKPKRPTKRARKSVFEPVTEIPKRTDLHFGPRQESAVALVDIGKGAKKMNTVDKSAMDWAGFVDKEGIADDLDAAGKSKGAYKARQEFLARVENKKIEDERRARGLPV